MNKCGYIRVFLKTLSFNGCRNLRLYFFHENNEIFIYFRGFSFIHYSMASERRKQAMHEEYYSHIHTKERRGRVLLISFTQMLSLSLVLSLKKLSVFSLLMLFSFVLFQILTYWWRDERQDVKGWKESCSLKFYTKNIA